MNIETLDLLATTPGSALAAIFAYIGPGGGLSALGALVALVAAATLAFIGFVWYPIKRLRRKIRAQAKAEPDTVPDPTRAATVRK